MQSIDNSIIQVVAYVWRARLTFSQMYNCVFMSSWLSNDLTAVNQEKHTKFNNKQATVNSKSVFTAIYQERCVSCSCTTFVFQLYSMNNWASSYSAQFYDLHLRTDNNIDIAAMISRQYWTVFTIALILSNTYLTNTR